jgi:hypothetical protein
LTSFFWRLQMVQKTSPLSTNTASQKMSSTRNHIQVQKLRSTCGWRWTNS